MKTDTRARIGWVLVLLAATSVMLSAAKIKTRAQHDKTYDFSTVKTWDWDAPTHGKVIMLRSQDDDPEPVRQRFETTIMDAVASQLQARGLARAAGSPADLKATYYLVVKYNSSAQEMGQFLPATTFWGLPPFAPATTAFKVVQQGSLVVDLAAPSLQSVVWRGIAETEVEPSKTDDERRTRIQEGIRKMLEKFPPKK